MWFLCLVLDLSFLPIPVFQTHDNFKFVAFTDVSCKISLPSKGRRNKTLYLQNGYSLLRLPFPQKFHLPPNRNTEGKQFGAIPSEPIFLGKETVPRPSCLHTRPCLRPLPLPCATFSSCSLRSFSQSYRKKLSAIRETD